MGIDTHFFLAVALSEKTADWLGEWIGANRSGFPFKRWVVPADFHITLHFLGHSRVEQLDELKARLPELLARFSPFELELDRFGTFGDSGHPRIFWAGVKHEPVLFHLQQETGVICRKAGFALEQRPYRPHVTMSRKWEGNSPFILPPFPAEGPPENRKWPVEDMVLYRTHVNRIPKYEAVARFPLG